MVPVWLMLAAIDALHIGGPASQAITSVGHIVGGGAGLGCRLRVEAVVGVEAEATFQSGIAELEAAVADDHVVAGGGIVSKSSGDVAAAFEVSSA